MIQGVKIKKLRLFTDERGRLMELLRSDDDIFRKFGQVYFTTAYPGVAKAWHFHKKQDDHFACIKGRMRLALYDLRPKSKTRGEINEFELGLDNPLLVKIPRNVYHGFKCVSNDEAIVINVPTLSYNYKKPDEYRIDAYDNNIPYDWRK
ncbi:dTDP-4-dehydrorhamnose 3,5-epimerase [bacterium]|nr:MAG: dTDP-4-dehydrorhamnose 3,5-epimerase [bacterium]